MPKSEILEERERKRKKGRKRKKENERGDWEKGKRGKIEKEGGIERERKGKRGKIEKERGDWEREPEKLAVLPTKVGCLPLPKVDSILALISSAVQLSLLSRKDLETGTPASRRTEQQANLSTAVLDDCHSCRGTVFFLANLLQISKMKKTLPTLTKPLASLCRERRPLQSTSGGSRRPRGPPWWPGGRPRTWSPPPRCWCLWTSPCPGSRQPPGSSRSARAACTTRWWIAGVPGWPFRRPKIADLAFSEKAKRPLSNDYYISSDVSRFDCCLMPNCSEYRVYSQSQQFKFQSWALPVFLNFFTN